MNHFFLFVPACLSGLLLLIQPTAAQSGLRTGSYRSGAEPGAPGPSISELALLDTEAPVEQLRLVPVNLRSEVTQLDAALSPNPTSGLATLRFNLPEPLTALVTVRDVLGRLVLPPAQLTLAAGEATLPIDLAAQPVGVYCVTLETDGWRLTRRLLKQ